MAVKRGLGKGLSALLPENDEKSAAIASDKNASDKAGLTSAGEESKKQQGEVQIAIEKLKPNPGQPRKNFDAEDLKELADSIKQQGIIQPIIAEDAGDGTYTIIAGERRTRAAKLAGLNEIPVILRKYSEEKRMLVSLIENIQRANLNPIEEAAAYKKLIDSGELSQDEAASRVGKNRTTVANALRLLKLPVVMQESVQKGEISPGHARAILSLSGGKAQETLFQEILKKGISVREAEKRAAAIGRQANKKAVKARAPELKAMEDKFISRLGTKVVVKGDLKKGSVVIDYYSMDDLERLYEILG